MHPNALVEHATELLHRVLRFDAPADGVLSDYFRRQRQLGPRERHTLAEIVYAVLRRRLLLQHLAQSGRGEIERRLALLAWPGNAAYLRAALSPQEVQWLEQVERVDNAALPPRLRHNLPDWLADRLQDELGDAFWPLVATLEQPAPLDLRVNIAKASRESVLAALTQQGIAAQVTSHSPIGLRVQGKPALHKVDVFLRGEVEVQDEGSQLIALAVGARRGEMVADFCAGGGGKTLALGAAMRNTGRLYAFDVSGHRLAGLKPRLARSGLSNVYPVQIAHERDDRIKRLAGKIDRVLVDAPCSGLGTLRRSPDLKWRQTPETVARFGVDQAAILASAARLVKAGGRLVYATCSLLREENEAIAEAFSAGQAGQFRPLPVAEALRRAQVGAVETLVAGPYLRLWPHRHGTDAFFAAAWERL
ncbi:MAG TPA: RsmB/NOP family class I SAM-dependent RNA methyltransferase [Burkholderiaceae bacterium]|nr:RsmB/NOP family class I SAM-dependent RNA methyltransferase [Burkholderiaceae bacterium]